MNDWDVYYLGQDGTAGRFAGTIIHVCPAGKKVGDAMVPPFVLKVTVTCKPEEIPSFYSPGYVEREEAVGEAEPEMKIKLRSRYLIDTARVDAGSKLSLADLKVTDRLPAARALAAIGGRTLG